MSPCSIPDAFFLHEGNETFIDGLVNFEKMVRPHTHLHCSYGSRLIASPTSPLPLPPSSQRLVASKVRTLFDFRKGSLSNDIRLLANKNPELQTYIR